MKIFKSSVIKHLIKPKKLVSYFSSKLACQALEVVMPKRTLIFNESPFSVFGSMPIKDNESGLFVVKNATFVSDSDMASVNAITNVFDTNTGLPLALIDGTSMTGYRTAGVAAAITDFCTTFEVSSLAVLGAGFQAWSNIVAVMAIRKIKKISLFSRSQESMKALKYKLESHYQNVEVKLSNSAKLCVKNKEIVITATSCSSPLFSSSDLAPGTHVSLIGGHTTKSRELSHGDMFQHMVISEDRELAIEEAGEPHRDCFEPHQLFSMKKAQICRETTIFSSIGTALMDLYFVQFLLEESKNINIPLLILND